MNAVANRVKVTILTHGTAFLSVRGNAEIMFHEDDIEAIVAALRDAKAARDAPPIISTIEDQDQSIEILLHPDGVVEIAVDGRSNYLSTSAARALSGALCEATEDARREFVDAWLRGWSGVMVGEVVA